MSKEDPDNIILYFEIEVSQSLVVSVSAAVIFFASGVSRARAGHDARAKLPLHRHAEA
jgi:hypothetical protein